MENIISIGKKINLSAENLILYGDDKAKIKSTYKDFKNKNGKLVLVTAITPTKAGEGKTTSTIGLVDGLNKLNKKAIAILREPSLGPVFGLKGGAIGGGKSIIVPSEDINLHFTGDMHALTSSINLISAIIDNHIYQGNSLNIDPTKICWKRALDMNDRELRNIIIGLGDKNGIERKDSFLITVASELMAVLCLSDDDNDFIRRVNNIIVAYTYKDEPIFIKDLMISNAIMKLMHYALMPNLVQTNENNPCIVHGGPFANIAHGCNSIIATKLGLKLSDIAVTEAGFGADLGAEKFFDIKCREAKIAPDCVVLVATIRALKLHGGIEFDDLKNEDLTALKKGLLNLKRHASNLALFNVPFIIAINHFKDDTKAEIELLTNWCKSNNYRISFLDSFSKGGEGATDLAEKVLEILDTKKSRFDYLYGLDLSLEQKIECVCKKIYKAGEIEYKEEALEKISKFKKIGYGSLPVCIAKTPNSFSDNPKLLNAPTDYTITVKDLSLSAGAGFIVVYLGSVLTMPGLPKVPAAVKM